MTKNQKIFVLAIIVILLITVISIVCVMLGQNSQNNKILALLEKNKEYTNYTYEFTPTNDIIAKSSVKYKDSFMTRTIREDKLLWGDFSTGKIIVVNEAEKKAVIGNNTTIIGLSNDILLPLNLFSDSQYQYTSNKKATYRNISCYIITLKSTTTSNGELKLWIEEDTGLLMKIEDTIHTNNEYILSGEYIITLNSVSDQEVAEPSIDGYSIEEAKRGTN